MFHIQVKYASQEIKKSSPLPVGEGGWCKLKTKVTDGLSAAKITTMSFQGITVMQNIA